MKKTILIIIIILIVIFGGYFLLRGRYQPIVPSPGAPEETPEVTIPQEEALPPDASVKEFTVRGTEYSFSPSSITVSAGDRVKITFKNEGRILHNLVIRDLGVGTRTIGSGQSDTVEFVAPQSGTYTFICSLPGHATSGMVGDLIVE